MRLNGWQRLAILLSILWALGAGIHQRNEDIERAEGFVKFAHKVCSDGKAIDSNVDLTSCDQARAKDSAVWMENSWGNVAAVALIPIPIGWFVVVVLFYVGRAQVAGFRAIIPWRVLSKPKKAFVVSSALATIAALLFGSMVVMNLYVDTLVPVSLGVKAMVIKTGDQVTMAMGTWTRSGPTEGSGMGYPLQTSRIICNRSELRCSEARASVAGNTLTTELIDYDIEKWDNTTIVFKNEGPCAIELFTIDLVTDAVNGTGHLTNKDQPFCKTLTRSDERWSYHLTDGFQVYWEQRMKARPLPLRLLQGLFGH